ncbi:MAG TPA: toprim domain-containing protein, partial [Thermaerobacter sp.]
MALPPMQRVSRSQPCPVCGKHKGCGVAEFGRFLIVNCVRVSAGSYKTSANGWLHRLPLGNVPDRPRKEETADPIPQSPLAPLERRIAVYEAMLRLLPLRPEHRRHLREVRGLSDAAIRRHRFRSLPGGIERARLVKTLLRRFGPNGLAGVPGFWRDAMGRWRLGGAPGLLIPMRDLRGRVHALQTRPDDAGKVSAKYCLVSSGTRPYGANSGTPYHLAVPPNPVDRERVFVVEGPLKAIIVAEYTRRLVVAATSAFTWREALEAVRQLRPRQVLLAFDADWRTNEGVRRQLLAMVEATREAGLEVAIATWASGYKGLDDYLLG